MYDFEWSVKVKIGIELCSKGCSAIVDSGSTLINGPYSEINELNSKLGFDSDGNIACSLINTLPSNFYSKK